MNRLLLIHENMDNTIPFKIFMDRGAMAQSPHAHEYLQMWYVLRGSCVHTLGGHSYPYQRFGLFIVPPYADHYLVSDDAQGERICCEFSERFINEALMGDGRDSLFDFAYLEPFFLHENLADHPFQLGHDSQMVVEGLLLELLEQFQNKTKYSNLFIKADLLKLLAVIASEYERGMSYEKNILLDKYHDAINQALAYLDEHFSEKLYLEDVCKISLMSQSSFSYIFKQVTGLTFTEYLMNLRIAKAQEMLKTTELSALDVALACGFNDSTYFSRAFRKIAGATPTQYRKVSRLVLGNRAKDGQDS